MNTVNLERYTSGSAEVEFQATSIDIWDKKYRLKTKDGEPIDQTIDDTLIRVARALADVEQTQEKRDHWYGEFLWALRNGAIPAGHQYDQLYSIRHDSRLDERNPDRGS